MYLPINLSVGATTLNEIKKALNILKDNKKVTLMYGQQNFPTKIEDINLESLKKLSSYFKRTLDTRSLRRRKSRRICGANNECKH